MPHQVNPGPGRSAGRAIPAFAMILSALVAPARGQQFGQWTWDARIAALQRSYATLEERRTLSEIEQSELRAFFGINGFLLHPSVASFRLGLDAALNKATDTPSNRGVGFRGDLRMFPTGRYPFELFIHRRQYDYLDLPPDRLLTGAPQQITSTGGRIRFREGPLGGLLLTADRSQISFLDPGRLDDVYQNALADWSDSSAGTKHHIRLQRQFRDFANLGYSTADLALAVDESRESQKWSWTLSAYGLDRGTSFQGEDTSVILLRVQSRLLNSALKERKWEVFETAGYTSGTNGSQSQTISNNIGARLLFTRGGSLTLSPFVALAQQFSDALSLTAPQAGAGITWARQRGGTDLTLSGQAAYQLVTTNQQSNRANQSSLTTGSGLSFAHSRASGLRAQVELNMVRNEVRSAGEILQVGGDIVPLTGAGTQDRTQARITAGRRWGRIGINSYADWTSQQSRFDAPNVDPYSADTLSYSIQVSMPVVTLSLTLGDAEARQRLPQQLHYFSGGASLRLTRYLTVHGLYREDNRETSFQPRLQGQRIELRASARVGAFSIEPQGFLSTQQLQGGAEQSNKGFTISIGRDFGGVLPIISVIRRRGVIQ